MKSEIDYNGRYKPSEDVVARLIDDELIIVPLVAGVGDMDDELYTMNKIGVEIWEKLDGRRTLKDISEELSTEYAASPADEIKQDVIGFTTELLSRKMLVNVSDS